MAPQIGKNLFHLLAKLPQDGLGARVAPIPWVLNNKPNSYYTITHSHLRYIPLIERGGFPVKLQDGVQVPADASWAKANQEISQKKADERARATRAGEQVADADIRGNLRVEEELDELLVETNGTLLKPDGEAWGTLVEDGVEAADPTPLILDTDIWKTSWREISDEVVSLNALKLQVPSPKPTGRRRPRSR